MKVLFVHCFYQFKGGEDTVVHEEIMLLKAHGISAELLSFSNESNSLLNVLQMPFNIGSYYKTVKRIKAFKPDIVHIHNLHFAASPSVIYAIKRSGVPFVMTLHNYRLISPAALLFYNGKSFEESVHGNYWNAIKNRVYRDSYLLTFWLGVSVRLHQLIGTWKHCSRFIVLTQFSKNIFRQSSLNAGSKTFAIKPNFCEPPENFPVQRTQDFLYIGRLSEEKGIDILLNAFADNGYNLIIAGNGPYKERVINYSRRFSNIKFLGQVNKNQVFELMQSCTALVFPSIWMEGMPLTIIEAFACGTPVITSESGAMLDMISDGFDGLHFELNNKEDLKNKTALWQSFTEDKKEEFRKNALSTYEKNYTAEANFKQLISIYKSAAFTNKKEILSFTATGIAV